MMRIEPMDSIPTGENPFWHDSYHMGERVASNVYVMQATHPSQRASYIIVVNTETGERIRIRMIDGYHNGVAQRINDAGQWENVPVTEA